MDMNYIHTEVLKLNKVPPQKKAVEKTERYSTMINPDTERRQTKLMKDGEHMGLSQNKWG